MGYTSSGSILGDNSLGNNGVVWGSKFTWLRFSLPSPGGFFPEEVGRGGDLGDGTQNAELKIYSSKPNKVKINWGDGSPVTEPISFDQVSQGEYRFTMERHYHEFLNSESKLLFDVSFFIENVNYVTKIFTKKINLGINFPNGIINFSNLESLSLNRYTGIESFPENLSSLSKLEDVQVEGANFSEIPMPILNLPSLRYLSLWRSIDLSNDSQSHSDTNFDQLVQARSTLERLDLYGTNVTELPANFVNLNNLNNLKIDGLDYISDRLPTSLVKIDFTSSGLVSFDGIDRLENIEIIDASRSSAQLVSNPISNDLSYCTKLKRLRVESTYFNSGQFAVDDFIGYFYSFIESNASMQDDTSDTKFRNMTFAVVTYRDSDKDYEPGGIYQKPNGFINNQQNGNPSSALEKLWVLVHQYNHEVQYRDRGPESDDLFMIKRKR